MTFNCEFTDNPDGWGPQGTLHHGDIPYQLYSKGEQIGRFADFTEPARRNLGNRNNNANIVGGGSSAYTYFHNNEEKSFHLVDNKSVPKSKFPARRVGYGGKFGYNRSRTTKDGKPTVQRLSHNTDKFRNKRNYYYYNVSRNHTGRPASIIAERDWKIVQEIDFTQLSRLSCNIPEVEDLCIRGSAKLCDVRGDAIFVKHPRNLIPSNKSFLLVTTSDDPVIREYSENNEAQVFATDAIMATLMCCPKSVYSWDIVVEKKNNQIFFDKRRGVPLDMITVNENSQEQPEEFSDSTVFINSANDLMAEAVRVNESFSQNILNDNVYEAGPSAFGNEEYVMNIASLFYRYRKWHLGGDISVIARCEIDSAISIDDNNVAYCNNKALLEYDYSLTQWRKKLETQKGNVLATELKSNSYILSKWGMMGVLGGVSHLNIGFISRATPSDNLHHVILGVRSQKPEDWMLHMNFNYNNAWAIFRSFVELFRGLPDAKYVMIKDPNRNILRIYSVPDMFDEGGVP